MFLGVHRVLCVLGDTAADLHETRMNLAEMLDQLRMKITIQPSIPSLFTEVTSAY
jgi:hypothetical protein